MEAETQEQICLKIEDQNFKCNKESLIMSSDYFKAMFSSTSNFIESKKNVVELKGIDPDIMKTILCFMDDPSSSLFKCVTSCLSVLQCASMLQFTKIQKLCEDFLIQGLSTENCLEIYDTSFRLGNFSICEAALTLALWHFKYVIESDQFLSLSLETVCNYLSKAELNVSSGEWTVWEAILRWIEHDEDERKAFILPLLLCLDFSQLSADDLASISFFDIISTKENAKLILQTLVLNKNGVLNPELKVEERVREKEGWRNWAIKAVERETTFRRRFVGIPCFVSSKEATTFNQDMCRYPVVYSYDHFAGCIESLKVLDKIDQSTNSCIGYRVNAVGPSIIVTGGQYVIGSSCWNNDVWAYCTITKKWRVLPPLPSQRRNHMTCVLDSVVYLIGGFGKFRVALNSVDALNVETGRWRKCSSIPLHGLGAACAFKNRILVFAHNALYTYYPKNNTWITSQLKQKDPIQKHYCAAVPYGDSVYLMEMHSRRICRVNPDVSNVVEYFGSFSNETFNVCLMAPYLVSFTSCTDTTSKSSLIVETLVLEDEDKRRTEAGGAEIKQNCVDSTGVGDKEKDAECGKRGIVALCEEVPSDRPFLYYIQSDISYGCFPIFKLHKETVFSRYEIIEDYS